MKARYVRISTPDQNKERQLVKNHPKEKLFVDVCSGSIPFDEREQGKKLLSTEGLSYVSVHAIDRLGRNLLDILTTLAHFDENNIVLEVDNLGIKSIVQDKDGKSKPNPAFKLIISVLANISEMERETMLERQREGIELAKAKGTYKGRVRGSKDSPETILGRYPNIVKRLKEGHSLRNTAKLCDVSLGTVQKVKKIIN
ncbi:recombinase family protein [Maribacter litoralis]|uniref:recombinase family protein n=1 Tax=Maribacter litoralis TaxID=2059726 RepID=UPI003D2B6553